MEPQPDRRQGPGRRSSDGPDALAMHGLLHDLAHEMATLSYLVEAARGDPALTVDSGARLELIALELSRVLDIIAHGMSDEQPVETTDAVEVRALAEQVTQLARVAHDASVAVLPGPTVRIPVSAAVLWRVLSNVVDNAARAVGPAGRVEVAILRGKQAVIEVTDDGPGFGNGPAGMASLGLRVAASLLASCGGNLEVGSPAVGGTQVRIVLPAQPAARALRACAQMGA